MSIQAECRAAMNRLAESGGLFTEYDVANEASGQGTKGWSAKMFEQAVKHAYSVLLGDYKRQRLVRYGPVHYEGVDDYARRGSKIIYAHPEKGPETLATPNGTFPRLHADHDSLARAGRRVGTNRDDMQPWEGQTVSTRKGMGPAIDPKPLLARIQELEAECARLRKAAEEPATNGNGHAAVDDLDRLATLLVERLTPAVTAKVSEEFKDKLAEALIS